MEVTTYKPQNPLLQKYIECIYTLRRDANDPVTKYVSFPSVLAMVCLNAACTIVGPDTNLVHAHAPGAPLLTRLICNYANPGWVKYEGPADEIVIYFKPLGISAFLDQPFGRYAGQSFVPFCPFDDYRLAMERIFAQSGDRRRLDALEAYWAGKFRGFEHPFLPRIVGEIMAEAGTFSLAAAAAENRISRTTLNKHFALHLGTTPSQFRKIVRFRNAMKRYRQKRAAESLTDISHGVDYFDQSHMFKDFKDLTQYSPKAFFSRLSTLGEGDINWVFLPPS